MVSPGASRRHRKIRSFEQFDQKTQGSKLTSWAIFSSPFLQIDFIVNGPQKNQTLHPGD
jgi:hypothetical protein